MKCITIGTRASKLAMIQTNWIVRQLQKHWPDLEIAIEQIRTTGDRIKDIPLTKIGSDGVFVIEIERALSERRIDLAVHSLKDLPTVQPNGLRVVVVGEREDVRDVLVWNKETLQFWYRQEWEASSKNVESLHSIQDPVYEKSKPLRIGTCSLRRTAQIHALYPGTEVLSLRGNVDTRLRKLDEGHYDAIVLAAAGLHRLGLYEGLADRVTYLPVDVMLPAPGQGALGLEIRDEPDMRALLAPVSDRLLQATTNAERSFMRKLGAGCYLPVAAYAEIVGEELALRGLISSLDGQRQVRVQQSIPWLAESNVELAERLGEQLAELALSRGADKIINAIDVIQGQEHQHV